MLTFTAILNCSKLLPAIFNASSISSAVLVSYEGEGDHIQI